MSRDFEKKPAAFQLPKDAIKKASIGQSFAEYDLIRNYPALFVETPAMRAAMDPSRPKCFFVGRRGTGKTAVTFYLEKKEPKNTILLIPQLLSAADQYIESEWAGDVHQQPFKTLVSSFKRAILDEVLSAWLKQGLLRHRQGENAISRERNNVEQHEFDLRLLNFIDDGFSFLDRENHKEWMRFISRVKLLGEEMDAEATTSRHKFTVLIDRLDDSWNGSDKAVVLVMALMHACMDINATMTCVRPLVFIRENVFDKVRIFDKESSRLETSVVSLDWTREMLREFIERRLNRTLVAKAALGGPAWNAFFESPADGTSEDLVFDYCQYRPRDVLLYVSSALESAQSHLRTRITLQDLQIARKKFSESRLKDLSDEYADNYAHLNLVLSRFHGLGREFTINALEDFSKKLLSDSEILTFCKTWIYNFSAPQLLIRLLYEVGFAGIRSANDEVAFKLAESPLASMPNIDAATLMVIHPTYADALGLQEAIVTNIPETVALQREGLTIELPEAISLYDYNARLQNAQSELKTLPTGQLNAGRFEVLVGEIIRLCFFRSLTNVQPRQRDVSGRVIRDWMAANHTDIGFWRMLREQYGATQIIWECKNYADLGSDDFHQAGYYMGAAAGRVVIIAYRGGPEIKKASFEHIRRINTDKKGIVILLGQRDLEVIVRQSMNGKKSEAHLQDIFDRTVREIS